MSDAAAMCRLEAKAAGWPSASVLPPLINLPLFFAPKAREAQRLVTSIQQSGYPAAELLSWAGKLERSAAQSSLAVVFFG
jgi:hypothetical protein